MARNRREARTTARATRTLSRRDFLADAALVGAGLVVPPMLWAGCARQPKHVDKQSDSDLARGVNRMKTRRLGQLTVSELGAGCMSISANYGPPADRAQGIAVIRAAYERGSSTPLVRPSKQKVTSGACP